MAIIPPNSKYPIIAILNIIPGHTHNIRVPNYHTLKPNITSKTITRKIKGSLTCLLISSNIRVKKFECN